VSQQAFRIDTGRDDKHGARLASSIGFRGLGVILNIYGFSLYEAATRSRLNEKVAAVHRLVDRLRTPDIGAPEGALHTATMKCRDGIPDFLALMRSGATTGD
jgi:hypothetical protein